MARIYGEIASSALMTFDKSFSRSNGQPLDSTEVYYSLAAAEAYAKTDVAYVGQKLVVIETVDDVTTVAHYGIEADGSLKELGAIPVGDGMTVEVVNGKIQLAALEDHTEGTYQPFLVDGKIEWRQPSATTVEGLDSRLTTAEGDIDALETAVANVYTKEEADAKYALAGDYATKADAQGYADAKDEAIAAAKQAGDDAQDAVDALAEKVGTVEEGKTVVQMIADAQEAATYDDTELAGRVTTAEGEIDDLQELVGNIQSSVGTLSSNVYTKSEVYTKTEADTAIATAKQAAIDAILGEAGIDEKYDTLREVADWILADTTSSAQLITRVTAIEEDYLKGADKTELQGAIGDLEALVGTLPEGAASETVVAYIQEVVNALKIEDYAKAADLTALSELVGGTKVSTQIENAVASKVDKAEGYRLMADAEGTKLAGIAEGANVNVIDTVDTAQFGLDNKHLTLLDIAMGKVTGLSDALEGKVDKVEGSRLLTEDEATKLEKLVLGENGEVSVSGKVAAGNVDGLDAWITARAGTLKGLSENNLTDTLLGKLNGVADGAQVNVIDTVSDEFTITGKNLAINAIAQDKVTGLSVALAGKVDAVANHSLISDAELGRIAGIESGAQVNKIEGIKLGETLLDIVDKTVVIPVGAGLKASQEVTIAADGTLGVGAVNVNKLAQTEGEYLVLNGGAAAL